MGSRRSTFTSSSGIVTQETIVMFSKIFIFAIISVTIRGSLGMDTNDLLDILESRLEDDRQDMGHSDLEEIRTSTEEDKMDQKLLSWNWLRPSSLLRRLGLTANEIRTLLEDEMDRKLQTFNKFKPSLSGLSLQLRRLGLNANEIETFLEHDEMDRNLQTLKKFKPSLSGLVRRLLRRLGLNANDVSTLNDMMEAERESNFLLAPIGLPLASAGKLEKIGGKLTLNPLLKKTGLAKEKLGKFLIIA